MIKSRAVLAGSLLAMAGVASAGVTVTPAIVSDYDWRGIDQTDPNHKQDLDPAFQLGVTYTHDSGFYIGTWGSNVDFGPGDPGMEVDVFTGYSGGDATKGVAYDVGINTYNYPGAGRFNFVEVYGGLTKGWFNAKLWISPDFGGSSSPGHKKGFYTEGNMTVPLPSDFSATAHVGYSFGSYWKGTEYMDYSIGLAKNIGPLALSVKYVNSNDLDVYGRNAIVGSIGTTLPWSKP